MATDPPVDPSAAREADDLRAYVRDIPDFPAPGIMFRDVTPLLGDPLAFQHALNCLETEAAQIEPSHILGIESRGFLFGAPLADRMGMGFAPARKPGKLPWSVHRESYGLEYGVDVLELHTDSFAVGDRVLIVDDVLATGGTARAAIRLVEACGATVAGVLVLVELTGLNGRLTIDHHVSSVLAY
jgi:adenine phosphoribosyltransferase